jgi:phosphatidylglycerol---prolipoprotein diacylglyceryl transferase
MFPELFRIGDFPITTFGLMMFLSFVVGAWVLGRMYERLGYPRDLAWDLLAWIAIGGIVGAKGYYLALHWQDLVANPLGEIFSRGGLVWYGGLIGGVTAYWVQVRARKLPLALMFDATAPALAVAYAIGRLGCFLVGDDYGRYTDAWYGIAFPRGAPPSTAGYLRSLGETVPPQFADSQVVTVHPTQLYEIVLALIMFAILWKVGQGAFRKGRLFALYMMFYGVERFLIEFVRAKGDRLFLDFSTSQVASIILFAAGIAIWLRQANAERVPERGAAAPRPRPARAARR